MKISDIKNKEGKQILVEKKEIINDPLSPVSDEFSEGYNEARQEDLDTELPKEVVDLRKVDLQKLRELLYREIDYTDDHTNDMNIAIAILKELPNTQGEQKG